MAANPKNILARIHGVLHLAFEDTDPNRIQWMPAHLTHKELGHALRSDGQLVTSIDLQGNDMADTLAKLGAELHRVTPSDVKIWRQAYEEIYRRARWIGIATQVANEHPEFPYKDSEASRWKADARERSRTAKKAGV